MLEISKASPITNTYHPSPQHAVISTAQDCEPHESQAMPIHRSKTNIPVSLCHSVWSHWNIKAMQGQAGARAGEKDCCAVLGHPAGYGVRDTLRFLACFLISHNQNHSQFSRNGWYPGPALNHCLSMVSQHQTSAPAWYHRLLVRWTSRSCFKSEEFSTTCDH